MKKINKCVERGFLEKVEIDLEEDLKRITSIRMEMGEIKKVYSNDIKQKPIGNFDPPISHRTKITHSDHTYVFHPSPDELSRPESVLQRFRNTRIGSSEDVGPDSDKPSTLHSQSLSLEEKSEDKSSDGVVISIYSHSLPLRRTSRNRGDRGRGRGDGTKDLLVASYSESLPLEGNSSSVEERGRRRGRGSGKRSETTLTGRGGGTKGRGKGMTQRETNAEMLIPNAEPSTSSQYSTNIRSSLTLNEIKIARRVFAYVKKTTTTIPHETLNDEVHRITAKIMGRSTETIRKIIVNKERIEKEAKTVKSIKQKTSEGVRTTPKQQYYKGKRKKQRKKKGTSAGVVQDKEQPEYSNKNKTKPEESIRMETEPVVIKKEFPDSAGETTDTADEFSFDDYNLHDDLLDIKEERLSSDE